GAVTALASDNTVMLVFALDRLHDKVLQQAVIPDAGCKAFEAVAVHCLARIARPGASDDKATVCIVVVLLLTLDMKRQSRATRLFCPFFNRNPGAHAPVGPRRERVRVGRCGFEAGRVADGAGHTWPAPRTRPLPVQQNTRQGRQGGALPK